MSFRPDRPDLDFSGLDPESLVLDPEYLDGAVIGVHAGRVVYDYDLLVDCYVANNEDKDITIWQEHIDFNTIRSLPYYGKRSPIIVSSDPYLIEELSDEVDSSYVDLGDRKLLILGE